MSEFIWCSPTPCRYGLAWWHPPCNVCIVSDDRLPSAKLDQRKDGRIRLFFLSLSLDPYVCRASLEGEGKGGEADAGGGRVDGLAVGNFGRECF